MTNPNLRVHVPFTPRPNATILECAREMIALAEAANGLCVAHLGNIMLYAEPGVGPQGIVASYFAAAEQEG
ncbi:MAG: hypothetical protein WCV84_00365 [Patescibacteria group bacterium]